MDQQLDIVVDLVAAMSIALAGGWLAVRLRLSPIFGYLIAGLIISPFTPGFVGDTERLRLLADIGVVLLLFGLGVKFSLRDLAGSGASIGLLAVGQLVAVLGLGYAGGRMAGLGSLESLFVGAAVALSSSTVMTKLVSERGEERAAHAHIAITWSIVQDLSTIVLIVLLSVAAEGDVNAGDLALTGLNILAFLGGVLIVGARVVPWALDQVAAVNSREIFLLAIASLALGTAAAAAALDISLALGAFLAGVIVSESKRSQEVFEAILPARDVFAAFFFVAIGMLIDPSTIVDHTELFATAFVLMVAAKLALTFGPLRIIRTPVRTALLAGVLLAQSGELSFVILDTGVNKEAVSEETFSTAMTAAALSMLATPVLMRAVPREYGPAAYQEGQA